MPPREWPWPNGLSPRVRGNHRHGDVVTLRLLSGLSPRVRGNPCYAVGSGPMTGSIPACTGEPGSRLTWRIPRRVYPRVYGGTLPYHHPHRKVHGLSPRVRGNRYGLACILSTVRSIPACTGEPDKLPIIGRMLVVYPRVYGGTRITNNPGAPEPGLSPRVRGNRASRSGDHRSVGSIPACTGEPG